MNNFKLTKATPYMLRNDGTLLTCGDMHPYIKYIFEDSDENQLKELFTLRIDHLDWFYENTNSNDTKQGICDLASMLYSNNPFDFSDAELLTIKNLFSIAEDYASSMSVMINLFNDLNDETNQEFCRVRTSNIKFGGNDNSIYFRISSIEFDWFDIIWDIVYKNQQFITNVTVCKDQQTFGAHLMYYRIGNTPINNLSVTDFINLGGNPIIEACDIDSYIINLKEGKSLKESFYNLKKHGQIHQMVCKLKRTYLSEHFK